MNSHGTTTNTMAKPRLVIGMYSREADSCSGQGHQACSAPLSDAAEARYIMFGPGVNAIALAAATIPRVACAGIGNAVMGIVISPP